MFYCKFNRELDLGIGYLKNICVRKYNLGPLKDSWLTI